MSAKEGLGVCASSVCGIACSCSSYTYIYTYIVVVPSQYAVRQKEGEMRRNIYVYASMTTTDVNTLFVYYGEIRKKNST